uniref:C-type lectin domain-containing protein n=1 Tax=Oryzias latipes TaxID=8090 RepID=H2MVV5_ORYLA
MAEQENITMRVIVSEGDIRKMTTKRPDTLEDLIGWLKGNLKANYSFTLQYQDPEFNNELCNLTNLSELPEKPTIKIIPMIELVPISADTESYGDTSSQADTEILSNSSLDRSFQWPEGWKRFGRSCYYKSTEERDWHDSRDFCLDEGSYLVVVNSKEEQKFSKDPDTYGNAVFLSADGKWTQLNKTNYKNWICEKNNSRSFCS